MDHADQVDHEEHDAVRAAAEREGQDEVIDGTEEHVTQLIRFARTVPPGTRFDMVDAVAQRVLALGLNIGELATLVGMFALGLGQPESMSPVVYRLAKHMYDQTHSPSNGAPDDDEYRAHVAERWNDDEEIRGKWCTRAAVLLTAAFDV